MHPSQLKISDFSYALPVERIARYPLAERDNSKLLVYAQSNIATDSYRNIHNHLPKGSMLVFNNTKVIHARMLFTTDSGASVEVFCLEPLKEMSIAMSSMGSCTWNCMVGRAAKWKQKQLHKSVNGFSLFAELVSRNEGVFQIEFTWSPQKLSFAEILDKMGVLPIPPYLQRESEAIDLERYQTVYAKKEGSVAAPTAGLHFTDTVFSSLKANGISCEEVTLHVGAGTFKPVKSETMQGHDMHAEMMDVKLSFLESLIAQACSANPIIAVGTTSLRTLESLYWMGRKAMQNQNAEISDLEIQQWDAYEISSFSSPDKTDLVTVLQSLGEWMHNRGAENLICKTQILIAPPYRLRVADALITNFHQPDSTLLLLVAAVVGDDWRKIYQYALDNDFRFLSYGDGSLLWKV